MIVDEVQVSLEKGNRVLQLVSGKRNKEETADHQDGSNGKLATFNYMIELPNFTLTL